MFDYNRDGNLYLYDEISQPQDSAALVLVMLLMLWMISEIFRSM